MSSAFKYGKKPKIVLLGYIVRGPLGGMSWHHLQYFLGLHRMDYDVYFFEDSGDTEYSCYDPTSNSTGTDPKFGLKYANDLFKMFGLGEKWSYYDKHQNRWHGPLADHVHDVLDSADVVINISGSNVLRQWMLCVPVRVMIDTDPVFTQIRNLSDPLRKELTDAHNSFFSFAENIGAESCTIPSDGIEWKPTRQPVVMDIWSSEASLVNHSKWTTVLQWDSYKTQTFAGKEYGMKSASFDEYFALPQMVNDSFELAIGSSTAPIEKLRSGGWNTVNPLSVTLTPQNYRDYIFQSKGEWSVAKHGYVATNSGWFSERSANYLASGKPVVVQNTGFSKFLKTGDGLLTFSNVEQAAEMLRIVNGNYRHHCKAAKDVAHEYFQSDKVLKNLLNQVLD